MRMPKAASVGIAGALTVGLVAGGSMSASAIDLNPDKIKSIEKKISDFLKKDPKDLDIDGEISKLTGFKVKGVSKLFRTKMHRDLVLHVRGKKAAEYKVTKRKTGKVVKMGTVKRGKLKFVSLARGKYKVTATRGAKSDSHPFKITRKRGAHVTLHPTK